MANILRCGESREASAFGKAALTGNGTLTMQTSRSPVRGSFREDYLFCRNWPALTIGIVEDARAGIKKRDAMDIGGTHQCIRGVMLRN